MIAVMIQPMVSSMMAEARITWPTVRRMKFISRITVATILTEAIDSAVPRNSEVISRLPGSGSIQSGSACPSADAAGEWQHDAGERGVDRGAPALLHQLEIGLHAGEQQQQQNAELGDAIEHRLLLLGGGKQRVLEIGKQRAQQRRAEHQAGDQLAHHRRLLEPQHALRRAGGRPASAPRSARRTSNSEGPVGRSAGECRQGQRQHERGAQSQAGNGAAWS